MSAYLILTAVGVVLLIVGLIFDDLIDMGPDWLTATVLGAFFTLAGLTGAATSHAGLPAALSLAAALTAGVLAAGAGVWVMRVIAGADPEPALTRDDLVGLEGHSILGGQAGTLGEVLVEVRGHRLKVNARCPQDLRPGDRVWVTAATSMTAVTVSRVPD